MAAQKTITNFFQNKSTPGTSESTKTDQPMGKRKSDETKTSSPVKKIKRTKNFQQKWLQEFDWLRCDSNGNMFCLSCTAASNSRKSLKNNAFVTGSTNYQRSALTRHMESDDHALSKKTLTQKRYMEAAQKCATKSVLPVLEAQIQTAMWLAEENLPNRKFLKLIDLQLANGASAFSNKKGIYTNHQAPATFQKYIAEVLKESALVRIRDSPFIGIMTDESLDIATNKKLILFCRIIHKGELRVEFCANISIADGKAETLYNCILDWLQNVGLGINKVSGFGSDGASVMTGRLNGVGVKLKSDNPRIIHIWCAAHRLALVSYWAAKRVPYLATVNEMLIAIFNFYQYSACRYHKVRELQKLLGQKVKRFKKPTQVRWLSMSDAVKNCFDSYSALILSLEHEQAVNPSSEGAQKAKGMLQKMKTFKFIYTLSLLKDVLQLLDSVSKTFQKDTIDIHQLKTMISSTRNTIESYCDEDPSTLEDSIEQIEETSSFSGIKMTCNLRERVNLTAMKGQYLQQITRELDERFPEAELGILNDLDSVLNPKLLPRDQGAIGRHGLDSLERCINKYGVGPDSVVNVQNIRNNFLQFKHVVNVNRDLNLQEFCTLLIRDYKDTFPDFVTLACILLTCPLTSVPCERGFSLQNRHHCASTSGRSVQNVECRMIIEYASKQSDYSRQDIVSQAAQRFLQQH